MTRIVRGLYAQQCTKQAGDGDTVRPLSHTDRKW